MRREAYEQYELFGVYRAKSAQQSVIRVVQDVNEKGLGRNIVTPPSQHSWRSKKQQSTDR